MSKEKFAKRQEERRISQLHVREYFLNAGYVSVSSSDLPQGWIAYISKQSIAGYGQEIGRCYVVDEDGLVGWSHVPRNDQYSTDPLQSAIVNLCGRQTRLSTLRDSESKKGYISKKQGKCIQSLAWQKKQ